MSEARIKKIVLTGGPGSGKTVIARRIADAHAGRFAVVPEAATQVYAALNTRWDKLDLPGKRDAQRRMYRLQLEQEARIATAHPNQILLLDRGTIDGAAYWPEGPEAFWKDVGSNPEQEFGRYDAVLWMETCAALGLYDGDSSNPCRFEDPQAALEAGRKLQKLWAGHPQLVHVGAFADLEKKVASVERTLRELLD